MRPGAGYVRVTALCVLLGLAAMLFGLWWATFLAGVVVGLALSRTWWAVAAGALLGLVAWSEPLIVENVRFGLQSTTLALAAILGVKGAAFAPVALTLLIGVLLGLTGSWLGLAVGRVVLSRLRSPAVEKLGDQRLEVKDSVLTKG